MNTFSSLGAASFVDETKGKRSLSDKVAHARIKSLQALYLNLNCEAHLKHLHNPVNIFINYTSVKPLFFKGTLLMRLPVAR